MLSHYKQLVRVTSDNQEAAETSSAILQGLPAGRADSAGAHRGWVGVF